jgi:cytochrome c oxidase assembly factor CtaG
MIDWGHWSNEPLFLLGLVILGWAYARAVGPLRDKLVEAAARRLPPDPKRRAAASTSSRDPAIRFYAGLVIAYLAVCAPWERVGRYYLFSFEVSLQMLLLYPAAGLLLVGIPSWLADWLLTRPVLGSFGRMLLRPVPCGLLYIAAVSACYSPRIYEPALHSDRRMAVLHLVYLLAGVLFWWPLASPSRLIPPMRYGPRLAYLFAAEVALTGAFTYLLMAEHAMYPTYDLAPRLIPGLSAEDDQLMGGVVLSAVSSLVLVSALGVAFYGWSRDSEKATTGRETNIPARP